VEARDLAEEDYCRREEWIWGGEAATVVKIVYVYIYK
jgi:hypothetical protein